MIAMYTGCIPTHWGFSARFWMLWEGKGWLFRFGFSLARSGTWLVAGCLFMVWAALYFSCFLGSPRDWIWVELGWNRA